MVVGEERTQRGRPEGPTAHGERRFGCLPRSDERRRADAWRRGLTTAPGRQTVRAGSSIAPPRPTRRSGVFGPGSGSCTSRAVPFPAGITTSQASAACLSRRLDGAGTPQGRTAGV